MLCSQRSAFLGGRKCLGRLLDDEILCGEVRSCRTGGGSFYMSKFPRVQQNARTLSGRLSSGHGENGAYGPASEDRWGKHMWSLCVVDPEWWARPIN